MKIFSSFLISFIFYFFLIFSLFAEEKPIPGRIISLGPQITKQLYLLGVEDRLIANTVFCIRPPPAKKKEKIGTVMKVNIEKIITLKPDLVIATGLSNPRQIERLKSLGIKVHSFSYPVNFVELCRDFIKLGRIVGKETLAKEIVLKMKERITSIQERMQEKIKDSKKPKVLMQIGARPLWVAPKDSFINDLIEFAGGINIGPDGRSGLYSREKVVLENPDVIIIVTVGLVGEEEKKIWQKYETLNAVKNDRIYILDSCKTYKIASPTPVSFVEALEEIARLIHP